MKRSPSLLSRMPPSPRTPSVISTPAPATPVGWNCQNSRSCKGRPARAAMPKPSPVLMKALVEAAQIRPAPPVANTVVLASSTKISPVSISRAVTPSTSPASLTSKSSAIHATTDRVGAATLRRHVALIRRVQHGMTCAIGHRTGALDGFFAKIGGMPAKWTLIDGAVGIAIERHPEVLEFVNGIRRLTAHELDGVLVAEPIRPL